MRMITLQGFYYTGIINVKLLGQLLNIIQMSVWFIFNLIHAYRISIVFQALRYRKNKIQLLLLRNFQFGERGGLTNGALLLLRW